MNPLFAPVNMAFVLWLCTLLVAGCDGWNDREGCDGYPYVANDVLPDTVTLVLGGDPFVFDLSQAPVFKHTEGKGLSYRASASDEGRQIARPFIDYEKGITLEIFAASVGIMRTKVWVEDDCEKWDTLGLFVQVIDPPTSMPNRPSDVF